MTAGVKAHRCPPNATAEGGAGAQPPGAWEATSARPRSWDYIVSVGLGCQGTEEHEIMKQPFQIYIVKELQAVSKVDGRRGTRRKGRGCGKGGAEMGPSDKSQGS